MTDDIESRVRRVAAVRELALHKTEIARINEEIKALKQRRLRHKRMAEKTQLTVNGIDPCRACKRHVPSPCNDRAGFQSEGPWDNGCRAYLYGEQ